METPLQLSQVERQDIQALVRFGHSHLKEASFHLLKIKDAAATRQWLKGATVSTAAGSKPPDTALQIAFTYPGLHKLGLPGAILDQFSREFRTGMYDSHRARRLGDVGANDPAKWSWGAEGNVPHLLIMFYAKCSELATCEKRHKGENWDAAFDELDGSPLSTLDIGNHEPFGFVDGTSQPRIDWERSAIAPVGKSVHYRNITALGEFVLGYRNEYDRYTERPLLWARLYPHADLPLAEDVPGKLDLGRNGTYLVFRDLEQDVPGFHNYTQKQAGLDEAKQRELESAMVGRIKKHIPILPSLPNAIPNDDATGVIPDGAPLTPLQNAGIDGVGPGMKDIWHNQFTYGEDLSGTACPHGAHVRRANPRTGDLPAGTRGLLNRGMRTLGFGRGNSNDDLISSTRFHRIMRRGREYVTGVTCEELEKAEQEKKEKTLLNGKAPQGLRFICLNANISRQFEFVQASWLENPKFDGMDHSDPLLGSRAPLWAKRETNSYAVPQDSGITSWHKDLPQFVTVRGGAYFFLPGIRALRFIAGVRAASAVK